MATDRNIMGAIYARLMFEATGQREWRKGYTDNDSGDVGGYIILSGKHITFATRCNYIFIIIFLPLTTWGGYIVIYITDDTKLKYTLSLCGWKYSCFKTLFLNFKPKIKFTL